MYSIIHRCAPATSFGWRIELCSLIYTWSIQIVSFYFFHEEILRSSAIANQGDNFQPRSIIKKSFDIDLTG
jgi:hypothetical protein